MHWHAKRAEEFLQVMDGIPCADLTEEALRQFFEKLGRAHLLADWQFRQYVNAICCLMHTLRHPLAIDFDWAYWRHSSRALSASHPTLLREQIVESLHAPQKSINPPVSKAQPIRRETISTPVNFERRDQPIEQRTRSASNSAEWVRNDSSPCPVGPLPHDAHIAAVVREIRRQGLSIRTEQAYSGWIVRLLRHVNETGRAEVCAEGVAQFLERLALKDQVSAGTQNQALCAIVFFFQHVLKRPLGTLRDVPRAKRSTNLPVCLSPDETQRLLGELSGVHRLMALRLERHAVY